MGTVVVRWCVVDPELAASPVLGAGERARLGTLLRPIDRARFITAHLLVRHVVAEVVHRPVDRVVLHQSCPRCGGPHGRPSVTVGGRLGPHVSLAHAGGLALVAVSDKPVGVDVEPLDRPEGPLRTWVRTEAVLKATGHGLDVDPSRLDVSPPEEPPELRRWDGPGRRPVLQLADLDVGPSYVASLARRGRRRLVLDTAAVVLKAR